MAKYTFTERCKEIEDLELDDGTTKIDNLEIIVKDFRILELEYSREYRKN